MSVVSILHPRLCRVPRSKSLRLVPPHPNPLPLSVWGRETIFGAGRPATTRPPPPGEIRLSPDLREDATQLGSEAGEVGDEWSRIIVLERVLAYASGWCSNPAQKRGPATRRRSNIGPSRKTTSHLHVGGEQNGKGCRGRLQDR